MIRHSGGDLTKLLIQIITADDIENTRSYNNQLPCVYILFSYSIGFHLPKKAKYLLLGVDSSRPMVKQ